MIMKVLVVLVHPRQVSFTGALSQAFCAGLAAAGHEIELADLYREGFNPCFTPEDFGQFDPTGKAPVPEDVLREQARLARAEVLALVFPIYWWSFPAMLKGWIDRIFTEGWAYRFSPDNVAGLMTLRKVAMLGSAGSTASAYRRYGYQGAMQRAIDAGIFGYCGIKDVELHVFPQVDGSPERRPGYLERAREIGRGLAVSEGGGAFEVR